jgi:hypothetical protein
MDSYISTLADFTIELIDYAISPNASNDSIIACVAAILYKNSPYFTKYGSAVSVPFVR